MHDIHCPVGWTAGLCQVRVTQLTDMHVTDIQGAGQRAVDYTQNNSNPHHAVNSPTRSPTGWTAAFGVHSLVLALPHAAELSSLSVLNGQQCSIVNADP